MEKTKHSLSAKKRRTIINGILRLKKVIEQRKEKGLVRARGWVRGTFDPFSSSKRRKLRVNLFFIALLTLLLVVFSSYLLVSMHYESYGLSIFAAGDSQQQLSSTNNNNNTMSLALGQLSAAYSQVYRAESLGVSTSQVYTWSNDLNRSAFLLQEATAPANMNSSTALIQASVNESQDVYSIAKNAADFSSTVDLVFVIGGYGLVLPVSYGLAVVTNRLYEWHVARDERMFFRRAIRKKSPSDSSYQNRK